MKHGGIFVAWAVILNLLAACTLPATSPPEEDSPPASEEMGEPNPITAIETEDTETVTADKWSLWTQGTQLRGANTWQRIVVPELDGPEFLGNGYIGPPYRQSDFDDLAALGANYVNLSHPGLFTERPPYVLDEQVQENLDGLIEMAEQADLFVVITFRTGPGRSDFTFYRDGAGDWFDEDLLIENIWSDQDAQDAWVEMWRYTAERYRDNPVVVGYDLMCEPNSSGVAFEIYEPADFHAEHTGTTYDWNRFYPRIVDGIREVDTQTPILVGGNGWSGVYWLPYLKPVDDPRIIYTAHQYEPQSQYTHQEPPPAINAYPGEFDLNWDGEPDPFDRAWLEDFLSPLADFQQQYDVPVAVNEFGALRWVPNSANFMRDQMDIFEKTGINYAQWVWDPDWKPWAESNSGWNFRYGEDPQNTTPVENELQAVILEFWAHNTLRPSNFNQSP